MILQKIHKPMVTKELKRGIKFLETNNNGNNVLKSIEYSKNM